MRTPEPAHRQPEPQTHWLLLRGLVREKRHWEGFDERMAGNFPGSRVLCLDLPGVGTEHARPCPTSVNGMMEDIRQRFLPHRKDDGIPWSILGLSLGGMITLEWCQRHPKDFRSAVVVNTSAANVAPPWKRLRWRQYPRFLAIGLARSVLEKERHILSFTLNRPDVDRTTLAQHWADYMQDAPIHPRVLLQQIAGAVRMRAPKELRVPTLLLASHGDRLVDPECSWQLARRLGAHLVMHRTAGHDLTLDDPNWVANQIRQWQATI
jgi:pimeloyl-ACP methyl ester carboxylesterase